MSKVASKSSGSAQGSDKGRLTGQGKGPGGWPSKVHDRQSGAGATMRRRGRGARRRRVPQAKLASSLFERGGTPATLDSVPDTNHQSLRARAETQATA